MIKVSLEKSKKEFRPKSLGQKYLNQLRGTETETAFVAGGETAWRSFWDEMPNTILEKDEYKIEFFRQMLGDDLYTRLTEVNDYEAALMVQNCYVAWGRANIADITSERVED